jgi:hypothetical protein
MPNSLESRMAARTAEFAQRYPELLSHQSSVAFSNPVNMVQSRDHNRAGQKVAYSTEELAERFDSGYRIDIAKFQSFVPHACHQEIEFEFTQSGRLI